MYVQNLNAYLKFDKFFRYGRFDNHSSVYSELDTIDWQEIVFHKVDSKGCSGGH